MLHLVDISVICVFTNSVVASVCLFPSIWTSEGPILGLDHSGRYSMCLVLGAKCSLTVGQCSHPVEYRCKLTPRFPEALSILAAEEELLRA